MGESMGWPIFKLKHTQPPGIAIGSDGDIYVNTFNGSVKLANLGRSKPVDPCRVTPQRQLHATFAWRMPGRLGAFLLR